MLAPHDCRRANVKVDSLQPALKRAQKTLDGLGPGSVILDRYGDAWQSARGYGPLGGMYATGYWYRAYGDSSEVSSFELAQRGPVKVIHKGGA